MYVSCAYSSHLYTLKSSKTYKTLFLWTNSISILLILHFPKSSDGCFYSGCHGYIQGHIHIHLYKHFLLLCILYIFYTYTVLQFWSLCVNIDIFYLVVLFLLWCHFLDLLQVLWYTVYMFRYLAMLTPMETSIVCTASCIQRTGYFWYKHYFYCATNIFYFTPEQFYF